MEPLIEHDDYRPDGDSVGVVDAAIIDVPLLLRLFLRGTCEEREQAYRDLTETVLHTLPDSLHVLQDCHDDGCPDCQPVDPDLDPRLRLRVINPEEA